VAEDGATGAAAGGRPPRTPPRLRDQSRRVGARPRRGVDADPPRTARSMRPASAVRPTGWTRRWKTTAKPWPAIAIWSKALCPGTTGLLRPRRGGG